MDDHPRVARRGPAARASAPGPSAGAAQRLGFPAPCVGRAGQVGGHGARTVADRMEALRVPKRRVPAEVLLPGGAVRRISLFLAEAASRHTGPERPSDLLNGGDDFVPALDEEGGVMTFLNRAGLAVVRLARELETDDADGVTLPTEHEVEILLESGTALRGLVSYLRPRERSRLVDFLNEREPFFRVHEERAIALVNKRHVARVVLVNP